MVKLVGNHHGAWDGKAKNGWSDTELCGRLAYLL